MAKICARFRRWAAQLHRVCQEVQRRSTSRRGELIPNIEPHINENWKLSFASTWVLVNRKTSWLIDFVGFTRNCYQCNGALTTHRFRPGPAAESSSCRCSSCHRLPLPLLPSLPTPWWTINTYDLAGLIMKLGKKDHRACLASRSLQADN